MLPAVLCAPPANAANPSELAVAAEYVRDIKMPGVGDPIIRPSVLHYDRFHNEVLVGDMGNNRIAIFGTDGVFRFTFPLTGLMSSPRDITTDPAGFIHVLGSSAAGAVLARFDFDGMPLDHSGVPAVFDGRAIDPTQLACDDQGVVHVLDHQGRRVLALGDDGITHAFDIDASAETEGLGEGFALGTLSFDEGVFYVPIGNLGTVHRYDGEGRFLGSIGRFGSEPGTLNFPVAAEVTPDGLLAVLDRPRYAVVCYALDGRFLGEFGGRGTSPGWFMGPSLLAVQSSDQVLVGQVFRNRIQVCSFPSFIREGLGQATNRLSIPLGPVNDGTESQLVDVSQRRLPANSSLLLPVSTVFAMKTGASVPARSHEAQPVQRASFLEVSK